MPIDASIYDQVKPPMSSLAQLTDVAKLRAAQQDQQVTALKLQQEQRGMAAETALNNAMSTALDASGNIDESKLAQALAGTPAASKWPDIQQHLATMREAKQKMASAEADHVGSLAAAADAAGDDPKDKAGVLLAGIASGIQDGSIPKDHGLAILQSILGPDGQPDPDAVKRTLGVMRAASQKQTEIDNSTRTSKTNAATGAAELPGKIADSAIKTQVAAGMANGLTPEQQATLAQTAAQRAETARHNKADEATARQRVALAQQRLAQTAPGAAGAPDMGIQSDVRTTSSGREYVDLSKYKGKDYSAAQQQAHALGVYGANAAEADALQNIDTARQNIKDIAKSIGKLPTNSTTRLLRGPLNKIEAATQTDPDLAAWGTYRTAAIQAMRAMAGSKGLRINKAEIEAAMANDIPEITDTQATARQKIARVSKLLDNQEVGLMGGGAAAAGQVNPFRK